MKRSVRELAILGGPAAFSEPVHVGRPNVGDIDSFLASARDILERRWVTNAGPYVQEFERKVAELVGVRHCVAVCNATIGLQIAIRALGLTGEVILPSFTFVATAHALEWQGLKPVFCDVDPTSHMIDPAQVERLITPRTSGIVGVHLWGRPCPVAALQRIAAEHGLSLLFDAAHAFACTHEGRMIGSSGNAEVFSFHGTKFLNTFEGGAVVTDDDELADKLRKMRNFGFVGYDNVVSGGTNGKMNEMSAAMGLVGLDSLDDFMLANRQNYQHYCAELAGIPGISVCAYDEREQNNYQYVVVEIDQAIAGISRDLLIEVLHRENVLARRYFFPCCHRMEPYRTLYPDAGSVLPVTEWLSQRVICLPTGTAITQGHVRAIAGLIRFAIEHGCEIQSRAATWRDKNGTADLA